MPPPSKPSSTKFLGRNRPPRVHITYDVETYGSARKIELPFVMGVMADLSGKPADPLPPVDQRAFSEVDMDNFDAFMKKTKPRVAFPVDNVLDSTGPEDAKASKMSVELTFESMEDFSPDRVAQKIEPLRKLLEARTQLSNLLSYMDGKMGAENLLENLISNPALMRSMMASPKAEEILTSGSGGEAGSTTPAAAASAGLEPPAGEEPSGAPSPEDKEPTA